MPERNTEAALRWIIGLLQQKQIPHQISGGFAAKLYGSPRELADIDIDIPEHRMEELLPEVRSYLTFGPAQYTDDEWDLKLMTLTYEGQVIDIAGAHKAKIYDKAQGVWVAHVVDFMKNVPHEVYGLIVPVVPKADLIAYKKQIAREVDLIDVAALEAGS